MIDPVVGALGVVVLALAVGTTLALAFVFHCLMAIQDKINEILQLPPSGPGDDDPEDNDVVETNVVDLIAKKREAA